MKIFGADWGAVLAALPAWERLSPPERRIVLSQVKSSAGASARDLGAAAAAVLASGMVDASPTGKRLVPRPEYRPLLAVLRGMDRVRVWEVSTPGVLADYVQEHFTGDETAALLHGPRFRLGLADRRELVGRVSAEEWMEEFLAADTHAKARTWESERLLPGEAPRFGSAAVWEAARRMVGELLALPAPLPLRELPARFAEVDRATLAAALEAGLRFLLLFGGVRDPELEPAVGPWPEVAARMREASPEPPAAVEAVETFEAAWVMEDMTTVLVAASAAPIRLRASDGAVFTRASAALQARMISLPEWVEEVAEAAPDDRVEMAVTLLAQLKLARRVLGGAEPRLEATRAGEAWLALPDRDRLKALLDPLRASADRNPRYEYASGARDFAFFPVTFTGPVRDPKLDVRAALSRAFLSLPAGFVPMAAFLRHAQRAANPLLDSARAGREPFQSYWGGRKPQRRDWERIWGEIVASFLVLRLAALGGARLGRTAEGVPCFALTEAGRYLLGAAEGFEYGHAGEGEVVVQPNFDVVFLAPAPRVEAQLARFAERVGSGVGVLFRLTRASVLAAAESGMGEAQVLEALRAASSRDLPANVARQLRDWFAGVRRVAVRTALLLECPDAETAARVRGAAGKQVVRLTDTLLELPGAHAKERAALVKKLRAAGVFVK
ncbi:MAG TPA: helicase-associated domain-containing protein [Longimicrobium sp.]|nr:helicase-associated domain-containing protein [Longimicrobium sp.]